MAMLLAQENISLPYSPEIAKIAKCADAASSLFLSVGVSLLESLIRVKSRPELCSSSWQFLQQLLHEAYQKAASRDPNFNLFELNNLIYQLQLSQNSSMICLNWMKIIAETNHQQAATQLELAMRIIMHLSSNPNTDVFSNEIQNHQYSLQCLAEALKVHIYVYNLKGEPLKIQSSVSGPILTMFFDEENKSYGVAYHQEHINFSEVPALHLERCPFFLNLNMSIQEAPVEEPRYEQLTVMLNLLGEYITDKKNNKRLLKAKTEELCKAFPQLEQGHFGKLKSFFAESSPPPTLISNHSPECSHPNNLKYRTLCGTHHCLQCLFDRVNSNSNQCPCGEIMSPKNKHEIKQRMNDAVNPQPNHQSRVDTSYQNSHLTNLQSSQPRIDASNRTIRSDNRREDGPTKRSSTPNAPKNEHSLFDKPKIVEFNKINPSSNALPKGNGPAGNLQNMKTDTSQRIQDSGALPVNSKQFTQVHHNPSPSTGTSKQSEVSDGRSSLPMNATHKLVQSTNVPGNIPNYQINHSSQMISKSHTTYPSISSDGLSNLPNSQQTTNNYSIPQRGNQQDTPSPPNIREPKLPPNILESIRFNKEERNFSNPSEKLPSLLQTETTNNYSNPQRGNQQETGSPPDVRVPKVPPGILESIRSNKEEPSFSNPSEKMPNLIQTNTNSRTNFAPPTNLPNISPSNGMSNLSRSKVNIQPNTVALTNSQRSILCPVCRRQVLETEMSPGKSMCINCNGPSNVICAACYKFIATRLDITLAPCGHDMHYQCRSLSCRFCGNN